jgi:hypothetical protein
MSEISSSASSARALFCVLPAEVVEADAPHAPHTPLTNDNAPATPNAATPLLRLFVLEVRVSPAIIFSFWCLTQR